MRFKGFDKPFLFITALLVITGFFIFTSASLGLLARNGASLSSVALNQLMFGLVAGSISCCILAHIHYGVWKKYALWIFISTLVLTALVFIPSLGFSHGGARRWLVIGSFSFQPAEFLKLGTILFASAWFASTRKYLDEPRYGIIPFFIMTGLSGLILLLQPDTDTFIVLALSITTIYFVAGAKIKDILILCLIGIISLGIFMISKPYIRERIQTFINPSADSLDSGYQIQQSLIAIGSGGMLGKGFGQSVQKFSFLPEPIGDSIFAVAGEEFGFVGSTFIVILFVLFLLRGYKIGILSKDPFGMFLAIGIVTMIVTQSFVNIASMLGLIPLSGLPLLFMSHGGTALFFTLSATGIVLNISRKTKKVSS